jgi:thioredoxin reductase
MISASRSYDLVILGSGIAGLAGAIGYHSIRKRSAADIVRSVEL